MPDIEKTDDKINAGAAAAFILAAINIIGVSIAYIFDIQGSIFSLLEELDYKSYLIGLIFIVCGFGILKKSLVSAISLLVIALISNAFLFLLIEKIGRVAGMVSPVMINLAFLYFSFRAVIGVYQYHSNKKSENAEYPVKYKRTLLITTPIGLLTTVLFIVSLLIQFGHIKVEPEESWALDALNALPQYVNNSQLWTEDSIIGYDSLFMEMIFEDMNENEKLKKLDEWFLRERSGFVGECMTKHIMKIYENPTNLLNKIQNGNKVVLTKISELKNLCFTETSENQ